MKRLLMLSCLSIVLHILNLSIVVHSECNVCNALTNTSCISTTEYQQCDNNKPFGHIFECNEGYYCSILGSCRKEEEFSDCHYCGECDESKTFACTGTQTYALCLGLDTASEMTGECKGDYTCNINEPKICGVESPTCSYRDDPTPAPTTTTTTTTTESPAQDPNAFCQLMQKTGRYPVGTNPQTTCRQYISCVKVGNTWYGPIYNCPGQTYFDTSKNGCVVNQPSTCSGTVTHLAFRNILLE